MRLADNAYDLLIQEFGPSTRMGFKALRSVGFSVEAAFQAVREPPPLRLLLALTEPGLRPVCEAFEAAGIRYTRIDLGPAAVPESPVVGTTFHVSAEIPLHLRIQRTRPPAHVLDRAWEGLGPLPTPAHLLAAMHHQDGTWTFEVRDSDATSLTAAEVRAIVDEESTRRSGSGTWVSGQCEPELMTLPIWEGAQIQLWEVLRFGGYGVVMDGARRCGLVTGGRLLGFYGDLIQAYQSI